MKYGKLVALCEVRDHRRGRYMQCFCECGASKVVREDHLRSGVVISCGCHGKTVNILHKGARTPLYKVWTAMKQRCENSNDASYENYGGRGISVSKEWHDFANFKRDMGERPRGGTVERIDNDRGYFKENCRWATRVEQAQNKRTNIHINTPAGRLTINAAARQYALKAATLYSRIVRHGWPADIAISTPSQRGASRRLSNHLRSQGVIPSKAATITKKE